MRMIEQDQQSLPPSEKAKLLANLNPYSLQVLQLTADNTNISEIMSITGKTRDSIDGARRKILDLGITTVEAVQIGIEFDILTHTAPVDLSVEELSWREQKILERIISGKTYADVSRELGLSQRGFDAVLATMSSNLGLPGCRSNPALVARYSFLRKRDFGSCITKNPECIHRWRIAEATDPISPGRCVLCGATKEFRNYVEIEHDRALRLSSKKV